MQSPQELLYIWPLNLFMRQFFQIFTCFILLISLPLFQVLSVVAVSQQRQEIANLILNFEEEEEEKWEKIYVPSNDYPSVSSGDEIYVNNNKYDVISVSKQGDGFLLVAINDTLEKSLEKIQNSKDESSKQAGNSVKFASIIDWEFISSDQLNFPAMQSSLIEILGPTKLQTVILQKNIPPPECFTQL